MQLALFASTDEIIHAWDKCDSDRSRSLGDGTATPYEQWTAPESDYPSDDCSLRESKRYEINDHHYRLLEEGAPVACYLAPHGPTLADGHHRLAAAELEGLSFLPIAYRDDPYWGSE